MAKQKRFRDLESALTLADPTRALTRLEELYEANVESTEQAVQLMKTPSKNVLRFKNQLDEALVNAGFNRWDPILMKRFETFAVGENSSTHSFKRILGVLKIVNKIRKFPRDILIWVAEYASDMQGTEYDVCKTKKEIDAMAVGIYGDIYLATSRQILLWNSLTWKTTTLIKKMKNIKAKYMVYAGNSTLVILQRKTKQIYTLNLKTEERVEVTMPDFYSLPKCLRVSMSTDQSKIVVASISNVSISLYQNRQWRHFKIHDVIPRSIQFFKGELYTLSTTCCMKVELQDAGPAEFSPLLLEPHPLRLNERKYAQKLYKDVTYGFVTSQGEWFRLHRSSFTFHSIVDGSTGSVKFQELFSSLDIKNPWIYEPFSNCVYRIVGDQRLQLKQIVL